MTVKNGLEKLKEEADTSSAPRLPTFAGLDAVAFVSALVWNCLHSLCHDYNPAAHLQMSTAFSLAADLCADFTLV